MPSSSTPTTCCRFPRRDGIAARDRDACPHLTPQPHAAPHTRTVDGAGFPDATPLHHRAARHPYRSRHTLPDGTGLPRPVPRAAQYNSTAWSLRECRHGVWTCWCNTCDRAPPFRVDGQKDEPAAPAFLPPACPPAPCLPLLDAWRILHLRLLWITASPCRMVCNMCLRLTRRRLAD